MSRADEMFKELGYEIQRKGNGSMIYYEYYNKKSEDLIQFWYDKTISKYNEEETGYITMQELQAINEKVGELRLDKIIEVWKDIPEYEGMYQASNLGNIKSLKRYKKNHSKLQIVNEKVLTKRICNTNGYEYVVLTKNGIEKSIRVHKLIANTFIPNIKKLPQINHKDGNKQNNTVDNLEWCTAKENIVHAYKNGLAENKNKVKIRQYSLDGVLINTFNSLTEASNLTGISIGSISQCINGKKNKCCNYKWGRVGGWNE